MPTTYVAKPSRPGARMQVYSNRPLQVYGYIVPQQDGTFAIQRGDSFTPATAPAEGSFPSKAAAKRALVA